MILGRAIAPHDRSRLRGARLVLAAMLAVVTMPFVPLDRVGAAVGVAVELDFPSTISVGNAGVPASLTVTNRSDGPEAAGNLTISQVTLVPSCSNLLPGCTGGIADPGTFRLSSTGVGSAGTACAGRIFNIVLVNPATGAVEFQPVGGPVVLGPPALADDLDTCRINFTFDVLKVPNHDTQPAFPGVQTAQAASAHVTHQNGFPGSGSRFDGSTIAQAFPSIVTQATPATTLGQPIVDTATLSGAFNPTGTITFAVFGPNDLTCAGPPVFTSTVSVAGNGTYFSAPFVPPATGAYNWTASYSGDANNVPSTGPCGAPNETSVITQATPAIVTQATPAATLGQPITDTATLSDAFIPTGTITFAVFAPNNPTCAGPPVFTSTVPVAGNGTYFSAPPFVPPAAGAYNWTASYSGDANNAAATSPCGAPNETSVISKATPAIVSQATPTAALGQPIADTATLTGVTGGPAPTGTVTFTLFGPDNPTCTGAPVFTSPARPLAGGTATSASFTPTTAGTYRWMAMYSGDANYGPVTSACNDANESSLVTQAPTTIVTQATPSVTLGQPITDTATVTGSAGAPAPTGTVTFTLFGPDNHTCTGAPVFTSPARPLAGGTATSASFTPAAPGAYRWIASYSGDFNYVPLTSSCNDANETSLVTQAPSTIVTQATPTATIGQPISDTATVTGPSGPVPPPTGTVTFTLFGPDDATCTGAPVFTSPPRLLLLGITNSGSFTPTAPGTYRWIATYSGDLNYPPLTSPCNAANESSLVTQAPSNVVTQATPTATIGQPISDTATVTGPAGAPAPSGTVTFTLFGPNDAACTGTPVFTSAPRPLVGGAAGSGAYTPTAPGTYYWVATYSGDANYLPVTSPCNAANESSVVTQAVATIVTQATPTATVGQTVTDTATVTGPAGAPVPTGTVTFTLFGPNDAACAGTPAFTSPARPLAGTTAASGAFTPTTAGTYRWVATYSGDANYLPVTSPCNAANESSLVTQAPSNVVTQATPTAILGQPISDTATVTGPAGAPAPTGTVTFTLFGPNDATCAGPPTFTSTVPLAGNTASSGPFTPSAEGTYRWVASYSGDANYLPVTSPCNDANESSVVNAPPSITVSKSATPTTRPEPGGPFTFAVTVTNTSGPTDPVTIQTISDNLYGDLATRPGSTCGSLIGTVLPPGQTSAACTFTATFNGAGGATQTDIVTVTVVDDEGQTASNTASATVSVTDAQPAILVTKDATPATRPAPGGTFYFRVLIRNVSSASDPVTVQSITDDVHGNLAGYQYSNCGAIIGIAVAPGATVGCLFIAEFTGAPGSSQTDRVTVTVVDDEGNPATGSDDATISLTAPPTTTTTTTSTSTTSTSTSTTSTSTTSTSTTSTSTTTTVPTTTSTSSTTSTSTTSTTSTSTTLPATTTTTVGPVRCGGLVPTIVGTSGNDTIVGTSGRDVIAGLGGNDRIVGAGGNDVICGDDGDDIVLGGDGNDDLFGGNGRDTLSGDAGDDRLFGEAGDDTILGRDGNDVCSGDAGLDTATTCETVQSVP